MVQSPIQPKKEGNKKKTLGVEVRGSRQTLKKREVSSMGVLHKIGG